MNKKLVLLQLAVFIAAFCFSDFDSHYNLAIPITTLLASPVVGSAVSGLLSGIGSIFGSSSANATQERLAQENREWQSQENQLNREFTEAQNQASRDWQEKLWNAQNVYNTPSAMMKRYSDAGLNPFLVGMNSGIGQAGASGTPSQSSPSMVGAPSMPHTTPVNYGAPLGDAVNLALQAKGVDANASNQKAQSVKSIIEAATDAFKSMGYKGFNAVLKYAAPFLGDSSPDGSFVEREATLHLIQMQQENAQRDIALSLSKKYSEQQIQQGLQESNYRISEIVGRLNTMRISNDVALKKLANDTLVAFAQAFKLRKEGEKYVADAQTINAIRPFVKSLIEEQSIQSSYKTGLINAGYAGEKALIPMRQGAEWNNLDVKGNRNLIFLDYLTDQIGDIYHVSYSSGNFTGSYQHNGTPFIESEWEQPNPFGGKTHYRARKY